MLVLCEHLCLNFMDEFTPNVKKNYRELDLNTVIKLLIRCRKLYQGMYELKHILQLMIKQELIFEELLPRCEQNMNEKAIFNGLLVLQKVSRRISTF